MMLRRVVVTIFSAGLMVSVAGMARAQTFPVKPVRIFLSTAGGSTDIVGRLIASGLSANLGQPVIIENRPGVLAIDIVAKAPPDGYTVLFYGSVLWLQPLLRDKVSYDPIKDFVPVTLANRVPNVLVVHPSLPVKSVKELLALAKARPGELNVASGSTGSSTHLAAELFKAMAGVNITRIPFKSASPAVNALIGGEVHLMFATAGTVVAHIKSGRLRAVAVASPEPSVLVPGVPTVSATGVPGYEAEAIQGMWVPAGTPAAIITRLNQEFVRALTAPDIKEKQLNAGLDVTAGTPEQFAAVIKADMARMGKVIKEAGIREE